MSLTESSHTYAQFTNLMFESLSVTKKILAMFTIIDDHEDAVMTSFVNDHSNAEKDFDSIFEFLHEYCFSRMTFESIYLNPKKTIAFTKELNIMRFTDESNDIRSSIKHKIKILE
jgi:virulence-associated protein VapD